MNNGALHSEKSTSFRVILYNLSINLEVFIIIVDIYFWSVFYLEMYQNIFLKKILFLISAH